MHCTLYTRAELLHGQTVEVLMRVVNRNFRVTKFMEIRNSRELIRILCADDDDERVTK